MNTKRKNNLKINKKGLIGLNQLTGVIMLLVVIGIMLVVGLRIESDLQSDFDENLVEWNATSSAMESLVNISENQGLLGTIIIFGVIISVVVIAFGVSG